YASVNYAAYGVYVGTTGSVSLTGVTSRFNQYGLYVTGSATPPVVTSTGGTFTDNSLYGVYVYGNGNTATVSFHGNSLYSNGSANFVASSFSNPGERVLDLTGNWWGTTATASIAPTIRGHQFDSTAPLLDWCGILGSAGGAPWPMNVYCPDLAVCGE